MNAQPVPTLEQPRALAAYLDAQREAETSRGWHDYLREQTYSAERYVPTHRDEVPETLSSWGMVKDMARSVWLQLRDEFREAWREERPAFLAAGLIWLVVLGIGMVMLAVRQGWVS